MSSEVAVSVLAYLHRNVRRGIETLAEAREFVAVLEGIDRDARAFLDIALRDEESLEFFYRKYVVSGHPDRRRDPARRPPAKALA